MVRGRRLLSSPLLEVSGCFAEGRGIERNSDTQVGDERGPGGGWPGSDVRPLCSSGCVSDFGLLQRAYPAPE